MWCGFNPSKTKNLDFSRKNISHPPVQFGVHGPFIQKVDNHIHLGVNLQYNGGWKQHINSIHEKACIRLNLLKLVKYKLCRCSLKKIYFSFIRPVLEYADIVWDNCSDREVKLLEDIQVTAARIISGLRINSSRSALYDELAIHSLFISSLRRFHNA